MQNNGQSATTEELTALECCDNPTVSGYFCQMITHTFQEYMTSSFHNAGCGKHIYLKFKSYSLQSKTWITKVLIFTSKML